VHLHIRLSKRLPFYWAVALLFAGSLCVSATPYASAVTNIQGTLHFILNEAADDVSIVLDVGAQTIPVPDAQVGTNVVKVPPAQIYEVVVQKTTGPGWRAGLLNQISSDAEPAMQFANQRGVSVNRNPGSAYFGRIYVSLSLPGTNSGRTLAEGIYMLHPHLVPIAGGLTGGLDFAEPDNNRESPFRLTVGPDDMLYICDFSTSTGNLYRSDPNVEQGEHVFGLGIGGPFPLTTNRIRGSISAAYVEGSSANSNLTVWLVDEDLQTDRNSSTRTQLNSVWRWDLADAELPVSNAVPVRLPASPLNGVASQLADLARGPDGKFYVSQRRAPVFGLPGATTSGLFVLSADGSSNMWNSLAASRAVMQNVNATDILTDTGAIDVSYDGKFIAVLRTNNSSIHVIPLINGLPDLTNRIHLVTTPTNGPAEDIAFDAAGNLYYVSSGQGLLRVLSPGGFSRAVTRTDGTFEVTFGDVVGELVIVAMGASPSAVEIDFTYSLGAQPGHFTVEGTPTLEPVAWSNENAVIVATPSGFRASVPSNGNTRFYRIRR
jgi:hypothetical protein